MPYLDLLITIVDALETGDIQVPAKGSDVDERLFFLNDYFVTWF